MNAGSGHGTVKGEKYYAPRRPKPPPLGKRPGVLLDPEPQCVQPRSVTWLPRAPPRTACPGWWRHPGRRDCAVPPGAVSPAAPEEEERKKQEKEERAKAAEEEEAKISQACAAFLPVSPNTCQLCHAKPPGASPLVGSLGAQSFTRAADASVYQRKVWQGGRAAESVSFGCCVDFPASLHRTWWWAFRKIKVGERLPTPTLCVTGAVSGQVSVPRAGVTTASEREFPSSGVASSLAIAKLGKAVTPMFYCSCWTRKHTPVLSTISSTRVLGVRSVLSVFLANVFSHARAAQLRGKCAGKCCLSSWLSRQNLATQSSKRRK